jgi:hypothetical protein
LLILSWSINKHGRHRQFLFLIGRFKKIFSSEWWGVLDTTILCDKVCQLLATGRWFSSGNPVSFTNKTDCHDITKILLKVALNTINKHISFHEFSRHFKMNELIFALLYHKTSPREIKRENMRFESFLLYKSLVKPCKLHKTINHWPTFNNDVVRVIHRLYTTRHKTILGFVDIVSMEKFFWFVLYHLHTRKIK